MTRQHALIFPPAYSRRQRALRVWRRACCDVIMPTVLSIAAWCVQRTPHAWLCIVNGVGMTQHFFRFFLSLVTLTFDLWLDIRIRQDFCTMHLTAKFHRPIRLVIRTLSCRQTNTPTDWQTNRRRWKHPPRFVTLRRWVKIVGDYKYRSSSSVITLMMMVMMMMIRMWLKWWNCCWTTEPTRRYWLTDSRRCLLLSSPETTQSVATYFSCFNCVIISQAYRGWQLCFLYLATVINSYLHDCFFFFFPGMDHWSESSAIRRHQPPQRAVLSQVDCFIQCEVVG